jgi:hypothetical protein
MYAIITIRKKGIKKIIKENVDKKEASVIAKEWQDLFDELYDTENVPKVKVVSQESLLDTQ